MRVEQAVIPLLNLVWVGKDALKLTRPPGVKSASESDDPKGTGVVVTLPELPDLKEFVSAQLALLREDHLRHMNPTPYKVSVSPELYHFIHDLWMREVPIPELE